MTATVYCAELSAKTNAELKTLLADAGIDAPKDARKQMLVALLAKHYAQQNGEWHEDAEEEYTDETAEIENVNVKISATAICDINAETHPDVWAALQPAKTTAVETETNTEVLETEFAAYVQKQSLQPIVNTFASVCKKSVCPERNVAVLTSDAQDVMLRITQETGIQAEIIIENAKPLSCGTARFDLQTLKAVVNKMDAELKICVENVTKEKHVKKFVNGELETVIESEERKMLVISDNFGKSELPLILDGIEPALIENQTNNALETTNLINSLKRCAVATDKDNGRFALGGICLDYDGSTLYSAATDGKRLISEPIKTKGNSAEFRAILPLETQKFLSAIFAENEITICAEEKYVCFYGNGNTLIMPVLEGRFPKWKNILPVSSERRIQVSVNTLKTGINRVSQTGNPSDNGIEITVSSNDIILQSESETGSTKFVFEFLNGNMECKFKVDAKLFLPLLTGNVATLQIFDGSPLVIETETGINVLMPIAFDDEKLPEKPAEQIELENKIIAEKQKQCTEETEIDNDNKEGESDAETEETFICVNDNEFCLPKTALDEFREFLEIDNFQQNEDGCWYCECSKDYHEIDLWISEITNRQYWNSLTQTLSI